jgi:hypothetical protein
MPPSKVLGMLRMYMSLRKVQFKMSQLSVVAAAAVLKKFQIYFLSE